MHPTKKPAFSTARAPRIRPWIAGGLLASLFTLQAAAVSLSDSPVTVMRSTAVKPNIMLLMDTSTSMSFTHMPDEVEGDRTIMTVGYASSQCNSLYYNPTRTYEIPKREGGTRLPTPSFTSAPYNYFINYPNHDYTAGAASTVAKPVVNLSSAFQAWDRSTVKNSTPADTPQAAYYWVYTATDGSKPSLHYNASACRDSFPAVGVTQFNADGGGRWNRFTVGASEQQNFANWYTYYRTRMALIKSGVSLAFNSSNPVMDDRFRLGLISMNPYAVDSEGQVSSSPQPSVQSSKYEPLRPFTDEQKLNWFRKLYSQKPEGYSPAREGLARVGRHYARETDAINTGMNYDDNTLFQYTCQQNFTIMTTDGYWNVQNETQGPLRLTKDGGGRIGQMDGTLTERDGNTPRPMWDGAISGSSASTDQYNEYRTIPCSGFYARTVTKSQARITQYQEGSQQMTRRFEKWITGTRQQRATTQQYTESTDRWFQTQTNREQRTWQVLQSSVGYEQGQRYNRGGGTMQRQRRTTYDTKVTKQFVTTDNTSRRETYQWQMSTEQRSREIFYWTASTQQRLRLEYGQEQQVTQALITQTQTLETSTARRATYYQEWGTAWRYEVQISERWVAASQTMCNQNPATCRIRDVARDTIVTSTPTVSSAIAGGCVASGPTEANSYTTTTCESGKRYYNDSGVAVGSSPIQYGVETCTEGWSGKTYTACEVTTLTNAPVQSCTVGTNATTKKVTTACTPKTLKDKEPISTCSAPAPAAPDWITTTCGAADNSWTPVTWNSCSPVTSKTAPDYKLVSCRYRYYTSATASTTTTTAPTNSGGVLTFGTTGFGYPVNPNAACAAATHATRLVQCDSSSPNAVKPVGRVYPNSGSAAAATLTCVSNTAATAVSTSTPPWAVFTCGTRTTTAGPESLPVTGSTCNATGDSVGAAPDYLVTRCINTKTTNVAQNADCTSLQNAGTTSTTTPASYRFVSCVRKSITDVAYPACSSSGPDGSNNFYRCYTDTQTTYSATTACVPSTTTTLVRTCSNTDTTEYLAYGTCTGAQTPNAANNQRSVTCSSTDTGWVAGTCVADTAPGVYPKIECRSVAVPGTNTTCTAAEVAAGLCFSYTVPYTGVSACRFAPNEAELVSNTATAGGSIKVYEHYEGNSTGITWQCRVTTQNETPVQNCTPGTTNFVTTSCRDTAPVITLVQLNQCTAGTGSNNADPAQRYIHTSCRDVYTTVGGIVQNDAPAPNCTAGASSDNMTNTTCRHVITTDVPIATCTNAGTANTGMVAGTAPDYISRECKLPPSVTAGVESCTVGNATAYPYIHTLACPVATTGPTPIASCTNVVQAATAANQWTQTTCATADASYPTAYVGVDTCTGSGTMDGNGVTTRCRANNVATRFVQACSIGLGTTPKSAANNWTTTTCAISNTSTVDTATGNIVYQFVDTCTAQNGTADNGWKTIECIRDSSSSIVTSCTGQTGNAGNDWQHIDCSAVNGNQVQYKGTTTRTYSVLSGTTVASQTKTNLLESNWTNLGTCVNPQDPYVQPANGRPTATQNPTPSQVLTQVSNAASIAPELASCTDWPCNSPPPSTSTTGGSTGSLADVAQYYYVTDLRPNNVSTVGSIVPVNTDTEDDRATHQHMTTFGIGLGVSGQLTYRDDYKTATTGDFAKIRAGTDGFNWPVWPAAVDTFSPAATLDANGNYSRVALYDDPRSIDDFWHASVNGRGQYFSANDPAKVIAGLGAALKDIEAAAGASSGATTSTLSPVLGDNTAFVASFTTKQWTGELAARAINITTGVVQNSSTWTAATQLAARVKDACDDRTIYYYKPSGTDKRANFAWNTKTCTTNQTITGGMETDSATTGLFAENVSAANMIQYSAKKTEFGATDAQKTAASGANLVNFLRGQTGLQGYLPGSTDVTKVFRSRTNPLGTIVNSQPAYVKAPNREYADAAYYTFRDEKKTRKSMVYVASNGGMLHAFDAATGNEDWAWVPTLTMSQMWRLGDYDYTNNPHYLTDGSPISGDIYDTSISTPAWKTILVAGLNNGGRGYYAIDVTDAANPKGLWEFKGSSSCATNPVGQTSDCDVGQSFGRPIITKLGNGTWVVLVTSGYNNTAGNDRGHLYILNAATGQIINKISTTGTGLKDINTYVSNVVSNNTAVRAYGGDLTGNIWRFDINDIYNPTGKEATLVGRATDSNGVAQPITTRVNLSEIGGKTMIFVGTGKLLHSSDLDVSPPVQTQSVYGFVDTAIGAFTDGVNADVAYPPTDATRTLRAVLKPLELTTQANGTRTIACTGSEAICASELGWRIDLPGTGERVNIDMSTALGTLVFSSNTPSTEQACDVGGRSWLNYVSMTSGEAVNQVNGNSVVSVPLSNSLNVGLGVIILPSGQVIAIGRGADGSVNSKPVETGTPGPTGRRVSWREITTQ